MFDISQPFFAFCRCLFQRVLRLSILVLILECQNVSFQAFRIDPYKVLDVHTFMNASYCFKFERKTEFHLTSKPVTQTGVLQRLLGS
jgi:hypothetical protein